jgi:mannosyltransferase
MPSRQAIAGGTIVLLLIVACWLRATSLRDELWIDELHTAWTVTDELRDVAPRAMIGNQSPLFYWPYWAWVRIAGQNEVTLRLPLLLCGLLAIAGVFALVWRNTTSLAAAVAAALWLTLHDDAIFYAVEARLYAAVQLVGLLHAWLFASLLKIPTLRKRIAWIILGIVLLHLHYTAALLLVAEGMAYAMLCLWRSPDDRPQYAWQSMLLDCGLMLLSLAPLAWHLAAIAQRRQNWARMTPQEISPLAITYLEQALPLLLLVTLGLAIFRYAKRRQDATLPSWPRTLIVVVGCWLLVPPLVAWLLNVLDIARLYHVRYIVVSMATVPVLAGLLIAAAPRPWQRGVLASVTILCALAANFGWRDVLSGEPAVARQESWASAIRELNAQLARSADDKPVFVYSGFIEAAGIDDAHPDPELNAFCVLTVRTHDRLDVPDERLHAMPLAPTGRLTPKQALLASERGAWFLIRSWDLEPVPGRIEKSLRDAGVTGTFRWRRQSLDHLHWLELTVNPEESANNSAANLRTGQQLDTSLTSRSWPP